MARPTWLVAAVLFVRLLLGAAADGQVQAWRSQYDSPAPKPETFFQFGGIPVGDSPMAVAPDGSLTSMLSVSDGQLRSFLTRHDAAGALLWRREFEGFAATALFNGPLESDAAGNTFVCGITTMGQIVVTKFDPLGDVLWSIVPDGPISLHLLEPGPDGSIYAAGNLIVGDVPTTYVVRLASDGTEEWRYVREGPHQTQSAVFDLAVDAAGNAVVGGFFWDPEADYLVVKIDPEGNEEWQRTFDGGSLDVVRSVAIGPAGRVTVSGVSAVGVFADYVTIQFDADGTERWSTRLVRPQAFYPNFLLAPKLAVDSAGAAYIVGESDAAGSSPGLVVKYDSEGEESWRDTFGDSGTAFQVAVDDQDNAYVAGATTDEDVSRLIVLSYQPDGARRWVHLGSPPVFTSPAALEVEDGRVLIGATAATGGPDGAQVLWLSLDTGGEVEWQAANPFLGNADTHCRAPSDTGGVVDRSGSCLALGPGGAVHVAGFSIEQNSPGGSELRTVKLDGTGALDWTRGVSLLEDALLEVARALAVDNAGNVVVAGFPWVTIKYDAAGEEQWVRSPGEESSDARAVGIGASGAVYVSGVFFPEFVTTARLIKYDSAGTPSWTRTFTAENDGWVQVLTQLVTLDERIVLAGEMVEGGETKALVRVYDSAGDLLFNRTLDSSASWASAAAVAAVGDDVIAAGSALTVTGTDALVVRLDSGGEVVWRRDFDGEPASVEGDDDALAVAVDPDGGIYVTGRTWNGEDFDVLVMKLDSGGDPVWRNAIDLGHGDDEAFAAAFDAPGPGGSAGSLWVAGRASNGNDTDALTLHFDTDGVELFRAVVAGTEQRDDEHYDLVVGPPGHATVAGVSAEIDQSYNFQAIRYVPSPLDVDYDGESDTTTDGALIAQWLFGVLGSGPAASVVEPPCVRCTLDAIEAHLASIDGLLDVDGNGDARPLTDGILLLRWLSDFHGEALVDGAVDLEHCTRCDAPAIEAYLEGLDG